MPTTEERRLRLLLNEYKYKEIDKDFICDSFEIIKADFPELSDVLNDVYVMNTGEKGIAGSYYNNTGNVIAYLDQINNIEGIPDFFRPYIALLTLRHEIEHANCYKMYLDYLDGKHDILTCVIAVGYERNEDTGEIESITGGYDEYCPDIYICSPTERLADIRGAEYIYKILRRQNGSQELNMAKTFMINAYVRGYRHDKFSNIQAPTLVFAGKKGKYIDYHLLMQYAESQYLKLYTRLLCGLQVSNAELYDIAERKRIPRR